MFSCVSRDTKKISILFFRFDRDLKINYDAYDDIFIQYTNLKGKGTTMADKSIYLFNK